MEVTLYWGEAAAGLKGNGLTGLSGLVRRGRGTGDQGRAEGRRREGERGQEGEEERGEDYRKRREGGELEV